MPTKKTNSEERKSKPEDRNPKPEIASSDSPVFDVIIIGGGAAGLSAALWCDDLNLKALLLEAGAETGGQLSRVFNPIKNHLGAEAENGRGLLDIFVRQIEKRKFALRLESPVSEVDPENKIVSLENGSRFSARALIIATGVSRRKLIVTGETKFQHRGIIESGKRDGRAATGRNALVVGGGDAALENALILAETAAQVFLVHRRKEFRGRAEFVERASADPKIRVLTETVVEEFAGAERLETAKLKSLATGDIFTLPIEVALIRIGVEPNTALFRGKLRLDEDGYLKADGNCETSAREVFAVGDVANPLAPTVSTAVGTGATAVKVISARLEKEK